MKTNTKLVILADKTLQIQNAALEISKLLKEFDDESAALLRKPLQELIQEGVKLRGKIFREIIDDYEKV